MTRKIPMSGDAYDAALKARGVDPFKVGHVFKRGAIVMVGGKKHVVTGKPQRHHGDKIAVPVKAFVPVEKGGRSKKAVASYFGGEITARQKAAHERKLLSIYVAAEKDCVAGRWAMLPHHYRRFVAYAGKQRPPFITGSEKVDQRLLAAIGGAGEQGEVCGSIKKLMFRVKLGNGRLPKEWREKLTSELGDLLWYFFLVCIAFNINFNDIMRGNMQKLVKRGR